MTKLRLSKKKLTPLEKELQLLEKKENKLLKAAMKGSVPSWKTHLESKVPTKIYGGLERAFCKGFSVVFQQGRIIIEKGFNKQELHDDYKVRDYAVSLRQNRKNLQQMEKAAGKTSFLNLTMTTAEGVALGVLGIGMPDILLFLGTLLKGIYECALSYGFDYETPAEQLFILKMMAAALSAGDNWKEKNDEIDKKIGFVCGTPTKEELDLQIRETASVFAMDMLLLKFIQGIPVVGMIGGAANPIYYNKVMNYVRLKYWKRYLLGKRDKNEDED